MAQKRRSYPATSERERQARKRFATLLPPDEHLADREEMLVSWLARLPSNLDEHDLAEAWDALEDAKTDQFGDWARSEWHEHARRVEEHCLVVRDLLKEIEKLLKSYQYFSHHRLLAERMADIERKPKFLGATEIEGSILLESDRESIARLDEILQHASAALQEDPVVQMRLSARRRREIQATTRGKRGRPSKPWLKEARRRLREAGAPRGMHEEALRMVDLLPFEIGSRRSRPRHT